MPESGRTICQLLHGLRVGGAEVLAARIARQLRDDYRFIFVCLDELGTLGEALQAEGFPVEVVGRRVGVDWRCTLRLARYFRRESVGLIHAHQYTPFFYGVTARLLYRRPPILFTEHGRSYPDYPRRKRIVANRLLLQRRDRVVGVGESVRQALIRNEGIPAARATVIYNGISLSTFTPATQDRTPIRKEMGVSPEDFVLLQVARLDPLKDHATAIRLAGHVARSRPDFRLVLVGEGPELPRIQALIRELHLEGAVRLLGLRNDVARLLPAADAALLTSVSEGIPLTLLEAMAAGLPVVSTEVGGVPEVVAHGETGLLAPSGDDAALARQVLRLAEDAELRRRLGAAGRANVEAKFSESLMLQRYRDLYEAMVPN